MVETVEKISKYVLAKNDAGEHFPLCAIYLGFELLTMIISKYGISPERLQETSDLRSFFEVLTTSTDRDNTAYVSTVQVSNYHVSAFQWHPEKNAFEWGLFMIPHSDESILVTQHVANFFVRSSARKVLDNLIYNLPPQGEDVIRFTSHPPYQVCNVGIIVNVCAKMQMRKCEVVS